MESGDRSVSANLLLRSAPALGTPRALLARAMRATTRRPARVSSASGTPDPERTTRIGMFRQIVVEPRVHNVRCRRTWTERSWLVGGNAVRNDVTQNARNSPGRGEERSADVSACVCRRARSLVPDQESFSLTITKTHSTIAPVPKTAHHQTREEDHNATNNKKAPTPGGIRRT